jgi:hypothetical protein
MLLALLLASCVSSASERSGIFVNPQQFVNQSAIVCGFMLDSSNIFETDDDEDDSRPGGLSIAEKGPLNLLHRGRICVEGEIIYMGCQTSTTVICTDAAFDYGIRIHRVLNSTG